MECSAEVETRLDNDEVRVGFEWNKDGRFIKPQDSPYSGKILVAGERRLK